MHSKERQRLVSTMTVESGRAFGAVLKSGICLALLILLWVIGSAKNDDGVLPLASHSAPETAAVAIVPSAAAYRKEVFDDRRARFAGNASARSFARPESGAHAEPYGP